MEPTAELYSCDRLYSAGLPVYGSYTLLYTLLAYLYMEVTHSYILSSGEILVMLLLSSREILVMLLLSSREILVMLLLSSGEILVMHCCGN